MLKTDFKVIFFPLVAEIWEGPCCTPLAAVPCLKVWSIFAVGTACQELRECQNPSAWRGFVSAPQLLSEEYVWLKWKKTAAFRMQVNMC